MKNGYDSSHQKTYMFFLCLCLCLIFFSFRNTRAENAGKLLRLMEGRKRAGRNTWGANSSGSRARLVIKPAGCNTEGMMVTGQVYRALFQDIPLVQCCYPLGGERDCHPARGS